jgi:hypothetical protein
VRRTGPNLVVPVCDRRWRIIRPTTDVLVRECTQTGCGFSVHYCASLEDVASAGAALASIVLDPALDVSIATATYDAHAHGPPGDDVDFLPELPQAPEIVITGDVVTYGPLRGGLLARIRDFFRR